MDTRHPTSLSIQAEMAAGRGFIVCFDGIPVRLPYARHLALLVLADCRLKRESGYAYLSDFGVGGAGLLYQTVKRLRQDIETSVGRPIGKSLIKAHESCTYELVIQPEHIDVKPNLIELAPHLPMDLVARLIDNSAQFRTARPEQCTENINQSPMKGTSNHDERMSLKTCGLPSQTHLRHQ